MSRLTWISLLLCFALAGGCATQESEKPHVLSGEAPVADVVAKGDESFEARDYRAAAILYQIAIGQEAQADTWFKLGMCNSFLGDREKALYSFYQSLDLNPEHTGSLEKLSLYYTSKGDVIQARHYLERLLAADATNWKAHNSMGVLADLDKDFTRARDHYLAALKLRPDLAMIWNNLGYSVYLMGDYENASKYMKRALEMDPNHEASRQNLALVLVRSEAYDEALVVLLEAEDVATAYTNVGYLAYMIGNYDKAEEYLEEAIRQSPTFNKPAHTYLAATRQANKSG